MFLKSIKAIINTPDIDFYSGDKKNKEIASFWETISLEKILYSILIEK